jgi:hypothetical protein
VTADSPTEPGTDDAERARLADIRWRRWGPYLAERQWGTVREDYSADGDAWASFQFEHARSRAYRWGEDGLLGICDEGGRLCLALALWNERDSILKERLFGLTGPEGNHGEDVKEVYWYLDATPTASYLKARYRYPQVAFPYEALRAGNAARTRDDPELELTDTGAFDGGRFFDMDLELAKADADDLLLRVSVTNHGPDPAPIHLLPTLWFRNTWAWGRDPARPAIRRQGDASLLATHPRMGAMRLTVLSPSPGGAGDDVPELLLCANETNIARLWGGTNRTPSTKDAIGDAVVSADRSRLLPGDADATKAAFHYRWELGPGETRAAWLRFRRDDGTGDAVELDARAAAATFATRRAEADAFFAPLAAGLDAEAARVQRQALAGLTWTRQFYAYDVAHWLEGDPAGPPPPPERRSGRNHDWVELNASDVLSMPDSWEYPWFAAWDLGFHAVATALVDPEFAKAQLVLLTREWYMHPSGQLPAYEWSFGDVNPPVHAWAARRVYEIERARTGHGDRAFLERVFHKLLLNFTWWVNREDAEGRNVFRGGFLGLDNIGVFNRDEMLPEGGHLAQADGTAWMGMFSLEMLAIALELARENPVYEDVATKFLEHFLYIAAALNDLGGMGVPMWDEADGFYYDVLRLPGGRMIPLKVRSMVGLIPLTAVCTLEAEQLERFPAFNRRLGWFLHNRPDLASLVPSWEDPGMGECRLLALVHPDRLRRVLARMLDPGEFLSDHGIRSLTRDLAGHPYVVTLDGMQHGIDYEPAESRTGLFGGNSNWRGPVWFPINYLLVEALRRFDHYHGEKLSVELPTGSGSPVTLGAVADELSRRLASLFLPGADGRRPVWGGREPFASDPLWGADPWFHEYFHGDTGAGLGASHQTGWTALVAALLAGADRAPQR